MAFARHEWLWKIELAFGNGGLLMDNTGQCMLDGKAIDHSWLVELAKRRCFVQQQQAGAFDIPLEQLLSFYTQQNTIAAEVEQALSIEKLLKKPLSCLSGGQQQRFNIARNIMQVWHRAKSGDALILLDEPCQQLDINFQHKVMVLLKTLSDWGNMVVMSSHDINLSRQHASHACLIDHHAIFASGASSEVLSIQNLNKAFQHDFIELAHPEGNLLAKLVISESKQSSYA